MTTDDAAGTGEKSVPVRDELQFEHAEFAASPASTGLVCTACKQPLTDAYYEINGKVLCDRCRGGITAHFAGGSRSLRFLRATLMGSLAALAGTALYYLVLAVTGYEVGLIAIVVGYMVGTAVRKGARYRGGLAYQLLAVFLTYTAIVSSYIPLIVAEVVNKKHPAPAHAAGAAAEPAHPGKAGALESPPGATGEAETKNLPGALEPKPDAAKAPVLPAGPVPATSIPQVVVAVVLLVMIAYMAPFLAGMHNILGLVIIFFGLMQAWQLNRKVKLAINGPFQVSGPSPPQQESPADA
jgi:hypothetical protein